MADEFLAVMKNAGEAVPTPDRGEDGLCETLQVGQDDVCIEKTSLASGVEA